MTGKTTKFTDLCRKLEKQLRVIRQYDYENNLFGKTERDDEYTEYVDAMRTLSLCLDVANELIRRKLTLKDLED